jgi:hypothetical protein
VNDEVLAHLVRLGTQAEVEAVRMSRVADRRRDEESRRRAGEAWRTFELRWEAVRTYAEARSGGRCRTPADDATKPGHRSCRREPSSISRAGSLASSRLCPGGHAAPVPAACPPSPGRRGNDEAGPR